MPLREACIIMCCHSWFLENYHLWILRLLAGFCLSQAFSFTSPSAGWSSFFGYRKDFQSSDALKTRGILTTSKGCRAFSSLKMHLYPQSALPGKALPGYNCSWSVLLLEQSISSPLKPNSCNASMKGGLAKHEGQDCRCKWRGSGRSLV